jgi:nucleoside 2-deoxyribosyltransferase
MKVYMAGRYNNLALLKEESKIFTDNGHEVTSSWLDNKEDGMSFKDVAVLDLQDVDRADAVVLYTEPYGTPVPGGGRHVEFGYGMGKGKKLFIVGPMENIFHWHPDINVFPNTKYLVRYINGN